MCGLPRSRLICVSREMDHHTSGVCKGGTVEKMRCFLQNIVPLSLFNLPEEDYSNS